MLEIFFYFGKSFFEPYMLVFFILIYTISYGL